MHIKVSGKQIDIGESLRSHVEDKVVSSVGKYFDRPVDAQVVFSRDAHVFRCDASVHLPTGLTAKAQAQSGEIYAAFEQATDRIEKQLRRYKRRLKDHHQNRQTPVEAVEADAYVLASSADGHDVEEPDTLQPVIIAEMKADIKALTVGEAVMQMELADSPFLIFRNQANGRTNVVFRRDDGNIGWVDPAPR